MNTNTIDKYVNSVERSNNGAVRVENIQQLEVGLYNNVKDHYSMYCHSLDEIRANGHARQDLSLSLFFLTQNQEVRMSKRIVSQVLMTREQSINEAYVLSTMKSVSLIMARYNKVPFSQHPSHANIEEVFAGGKGFPLMKQAHKKVKEIIEKKGTENVSLRDFNYWDALCKNYIAIFNKLHDVNFLRILIFVCSLGSNYESMVSFSSEYHLMFSLGVEDGLQMVYILNEQPTKIVELLKTIYFNIRPFTFTDLYFSSTTNIVVLINKTYNKCLYLYNHMDDGTKKLILNGAKTLAFNYIGVPAWGRFIFSFFMCSTTAPTPVVPTVLVESKPLVIHPYVILPTTCFKKDIKEGIDTMIDVGSSAGYYSSKVFWSVIAGISRAKSETATTVLTDWLNVFVTARNSLKNSNSKGKSETFELEEYD